MQFEKVSDDFYFRPMLGWSDQNRPCVLPIFYCCHVQHWRGQSFWSCNPFVHCTHVFLRRD